MLIMDDEQLAVLYALRTANGTSHVTCHHLFTALPKILRLRWSERYLSGVVLRDLIRADFVEVHQSSPGELHYVLTRRGVAQL